MDKSAGIHLRNVATLSEQIQNKLRQLNITTAEELVSVAAVEGCSELLTKFLGVSAKVFSGHLENVKKNMSPRAVAAMEQPYAQEFGLGALEPPKEMRLATAGPYESAVAVAALPAAVNLISRMPPIHSQGARGTCVGFACTALNEDYNTVVNSTTPDLSEQCLYKRCKEIDGVPNAQGTWVFVAMDCLVRFGQATETCEPYNPNSPTNQPGPHPPCCTTESPNYKIHDKVQLNQNSANDVKAALADGNVVAFAIPAYLSWLNSAAVRQSGNITMPLPNEQPYDANGNYLGHAMLFVGYQDDSATPGGGYFILRNSWGTSWGSLSQYGAGYGTLPYQYMIDKGAEAWVYARPPVPICPPRPIPCPPAPRLCPPAPRLCPVRPRLCPPRPIPCPPAPRICPPAPAYPPPWFYDPAAAYYYQPEAWSAGYYPQGPYSYPEAYYPSGYPAESAYYDPWSSAYGGYDPWGSFYGGGYDPWSAYWGGYGPDPNLPPSSLRAGRFTPTLKQKK